MELPIVNPNQLILMVAEKSTGIMLNFDWTRYFKGQSIPFKVFDDLESLKSFIFAVLDRNNLEFLIYNSQHEFVERNW